MGQTAVDNVCKVPVTGAETFESFKQATGLKDLAALEAWDQKREDYRYWLDNKIDEFEDLKAETIAQNAAKPNWLQSWWKSAEPTEDHRRDAKDRISQILAKAKAGKKDDREKFHNFDTELKKHIA